jgi:hypothetical protein
MRRITSEVLCYRWPGVSRSTVWRHYLRWRAEQGLPMRCDNHLCQFHAMDLVWNGKPFKPVLDHENGNSDDNRTKNLRLLCPNCESQLATRGGGNRGRVERATGGFALVSRSGARHYVMPVEPATFTVAGQALRLGKT